MLYCTYFPSPIGQLKITCSDSHLTSVIFCEGEEAATQNHPLLRDCCIQLEEYFSGKRKNFNLPLQQSGTEFQQKVWRSLFQIPYGRTTSYAQLSKDLCNIKAIRAVAAANGKNKIWIIVPCHRVIGSTGSLTGYAGGIWRKEWLLNHEMQFASGVQQLTLLK